MAKRKVAKTKEQRVSRKSQRVSTSKATNRSDDGELDLNNPTSISPEGGGVSDPSIRDAAEGKKSITSGRCYLLEMTAEIRQKIWNYAAKHDTTINPRQVKERSNKFWPCRKAPESCPDKSLGENKLSPQSPAETKPSLQSLAEKKPSPQSLVTAAQLSATCHQIYDEVTGTGLFYKINQFTFVAFNDMLCYLVAITPIRRNSIRSVIIDWNHERWAMKHAITMLATCEGLQRLEITISGYYRWFSPLAYWNGSGFQFIVTSDIRGLESFKLTATEPRLDASNTLLSSMGNAEMVIEQELADLKIRSRELEGMLRMPRVVPVPLRQIRAAQEASKLNIFGEGRLGPDKRPGIIASRTRGQLQKQKSLNDIGLLEEADEHPKFSKFGDLLWDIRTITQSRELVSDVSGRRIEVYVTWANKAEKSWEILDRIVNVSNVLRVAGHYIRNPEAYDLGTAISTIKDFVEKDEVKTLALESLTAVLKRNDNTEAGAKAKRLRRYKAFR